jgi:hypothetical protein
MIGAIMGVGSGKSFSSVGILSADRPLEICWEISAFPMATHPWQMVPPTKEKHVKTFSPRKDYVSLTTVLIHIYILGMGLIQLLILLLLIHLFF